MSESHSATPPSERDALDVALDWADAEDQLPAEAYELLASLRAKAARCDRREADRSVIYVITTSDEDGAGAQVDGVVERAQALTAEEIKRAEERYDELWVEYRALDMGKVVKEQRPEYRWPQILCDEFGFTRCDWLEVRDGVADRPR